MSALDLYESRPGEEPLTPTTQEKVAIVVLRHPASVAVLVERTGIAFELLVAGGGGDRSSKIGHDVHICVHVREIGAVGATPGS